MGQYRIGTAIMNSSPYRIVNSRVVFLVGGGSTRSSIRARDRLSHCVVGHVVARRGSVLAIGLQNHRSQADDRFQVISSALRQNTCTAVAGRRLLDSAARRFG